MLGNPMVGEVMKASYDQQVKDQNLMTPHPKRYDIVTDEKVPVTQHAWDRAELLCSIQQLQRQIVNFTINSPASATLTIADLDEQRKKLLAVSIFIHNLGVVGPRG